MKKYTLLKYIAFLIMIAVTSCKNKNEEPVPEALPVLMSGKVISDVDYQPCPGVAVYFERAEYATTKFLWWDITSPTGRFLPIDTLFTDFKGAFSHMITMQQRSADYRFRFVGHITFQESIITIPAFRDGMEITMYPYAYLKVNYKRYDVGNRSCDYYFLDLYQDVKDSAYGSLLTWSYGQKIPQEKIIPLKPGKYYIRSKYSCGAYNGYERDSFNIIGLDTLEVKDLLSY